MLRTNKAFFNILLILFFLNLGDAFATYYWVVSGVAEELNPIAIALLEASPILFLIFKCLFGSLALVFLWLFREKYKKITLIVTVCWSFVYFLILSYHIKFIIDYYKFL
tara:strand:+ start:143 stop:469 length:327 start_codon:yes stop_codon:yes gene_type:complete